MPGASNFGRAFGQGVASHTSVSAIEGVWLGEDKGEAHNPIQCRICWRENQDPSVFISPCKCTGTQKYVCVKCLRQWQDNLLSVRAYRCNVCCARFSLQPRMYGGGVSLMQWLRAAGGALWLGMLAFGLSSSPWPHIALLGILLLGMVRTPRGPPTLTSLLCLCLLLGASFVALLQFKGMRMVMRLDVQGKVGMALIHHGASVHGLGAGSILVASQDMHDGGIFTRSVVLVVDHSPTQGSRGVILTSPLHGLHDTHPTPPPRGTLRHMVGGPVGAPGSPAAEEVLLHTAEGIQGAVLLLPHHHGIDVSSLHHHEAHSQQQDKGGEGGEARTGPPPPPPQRRSMTSGSDVSSQHDMASGATKDDEIGGRNTTAGLSLFMGGDRSEVQEQLQQAKGDAWLFYGVAKWARGQLEGEIRAGLWGLAHATPRELMLHVSPEQLWSRIMHQEPHTVRFLAL